MTRTEHLQWCKTRALEELNYYKDDAEAIRNCLTSMMSDLRKHPEGDPSGTLAMLTLGHMTIIKTRSAAKQFIEGFN